VEWGRVEGVRMMRRRMMMMMKWLRLKHQMEDVVVLAGHPQQQLRGGVVLPSFDPPFPQLICDLGNDFKGGGKEEKRRKDGQEVE
jgi:hypothetical protein